MPKLVQFKSLLYLNYSEECKDHFHGMFLDFINCSLKHELQSAAKNVSFLLVHIFEEINLGTFSKNY